MRNKITKEIRVIKTEKGEKRAVKLESDLGENMCELMDYWL